MLKKNHLFRTLIAMAAFAILATSCSKDDENDPKDKTPKDPYLTTDFSHGTYILSEGNMGNETGLLTFITPSGVILDSVYIKVNKGHKLGNVCQSACVYDDKIYVLSQNGETNGGDGMIVVADLKTMKYITAYKKSELNLTRPTHIAVVSKEKAYVRNSNGLNIIDLVGHSVKTTIANTGGVNSIPLLVLGTNIYTGKSNTLLILDTKTDAFTTKAMPGKVSNVILAKDGNLWVSCGTNIAKVSPSGDIIKQNALGVSPSGYDAVGLCESIDGNSLFFTVGSKVYKHNFATNATALFVEPKTMVEDSKGAIIYGQLAINPTNGKLYVPTISDYATYKDNCVSTYNTAATTADKAIDRIYNKTSFVAAIYCRK